MDSRLNILVIEDNPADFKLIERQLSSHGMCADCRRTDCIEELRKLLEEQQWDLILSDYSVPAMDFIETFSFLKLRVARLPVILVSGSVGEEKAIELLKLGVADFVLKDNLTRLVPAIERALQESAERQARLTAEDNLRESENRFRNIFDNSPIAIGIGEIPGGLLIEVNDAWLRLFGYDRAEVIGRTTVELCLYVRNEERDEIIGIIAEHGRVVNHAVQLRRKSGEVMDILYSAELVNLAGKSCLQVMMTDVTEQNRSIVKTLESEQRFLSLFDNMLEGFASCRMIPGENGQSRDFVYLSVNKAFAELTGLSNVVGKRVSEVIPGILESNPEMLATYGRVASTGQAERFESLVPSLGIWFSISVYSMERGCFIALFDNITARKSAEAAQNATIDLLRICNEAAGSWDFMRMTTEYFQEIAGCEAVGVRLREGDDFPYFETRGFPAEFVQAENSLCSRDQQGELNRDHCGHPALDCMCGNIICSRFDPSKPFFSERGSFWSSCTTELLASTTDADRQAKTRNRCNGEGYESVALVPLRSQGETFGLFQFNDRRKGRFTPEKIVLLEDLVSYVAIALAKLRTDEALQLTTKRLRLATASGHLGIWDWDIAKNIMDWDERMFEIYGISAGTAPGCYESWAENLHGDDRDMADDRLRRALNGEKEYDFEFRIVPANGTIKHIKTNALVLRDTDGVAMRMIGINQDITERKQLEEQLFQSQKMEAIGQLAGGVAHDFNNILSVIMGYGGMLQLETGLNSLQQEKLNQIIAATEKAAQLTRGLLAFSRKQTLTPKTVNLNDLVQHLQKFLVRVIGEDIHLKSVWNEVELPVSVDSGQIEQALINLGTNARDAMPQGGVLTIETGHQEVDGSFADGQGYGQAGRYAVITVADTGSGMNAEIQKKIFEPFFTTKETGKGTGLGLAIVYGIIKQHNGFINLYSEPGKGTTFRIYLPLTATEELPLEEQTAPTLPKGGSETILVAEDDQTVRTLVATVLTEYGYDVILAADGREAVAQFAVNRDRIRLILMDMIMPGQSGKAAADEIRLLQPETRILFTSGYTADFIKNRGVDEQDEELIMKPVQPLEMLRKVREMLDR